MCRSQVVVALVSLIGFTAVAGAGEHGAIAPLARMTAKSSPQKPRRDMAWVRVHRRQIAFVVTKQSEEPGLETIYRTGFSFHVITERGFAKCKLVRLRKRALAGGVAEYQLVLTGSPLLHGQVGLVVPSDMVKGRPRLRRPVVRPLARFPKLLARTRATLAKRLAREATLAPSIRDLRRHAVIMKARLPRPATHLVHYRHLHDNMGNRETGLFSVDPNGRVVDVLLTGEKPYHSHGVAYLVDLDGDGRDEVMHVIDRWEGPDFILLPAWAGGRYAPERIGVSVTPKHLPHEVIVGKVAKTAGGHLLVQPPTSSWSVPTP